jgi:type IV pilus assembly protein PilF
MGQEYMQVGQTAIALSRLKRGLVVDPDNPEVHAVLGQLYASINETTLAEKHYARALELDPLNPAFRNAWGSFLCQQGKYDLAETEFRRALSNSLYTKPWETQTNAGICALRAGNSQKGETYLRMALAANPQVPLALMALAKLQLSRGKYAEASGYLTRYEQIAGLSAQSLLLKCQAALGMGDRAAALSFREALIKFFPNAPETQTAKRLIAP